MLIWHESTSLPRCLQVLSRETNNRLQCTTELKGPTRPSWRWWSSSSPGLWLNFPLSSVPLDIIHSPLHLLFSMEYMSADEADNRRRLLYVVCYTPTYISQYKQKYLDKNTMPTLILFMEISQGPKHKWQWKIYQYLPYFLSVIT